MIEQNLGELLEDKVTLDIEGIDRMYINAYQPMLQTGQVAVIVKVSVAKTIKSCSLFHGRSPMFRRLFTRI